MSDSEVNNFPNNFIYLLGNEMGSPNVGESGGALEETPS